MQLSQPSSHLEMFSITEARKLTDNLDQGIYKDALAYLTGDGKDQRGLKL